MHIPAPKGRGSLSNRAGRFEHQDSLPSDDGWGILETLNPAPATQYIQDTTREIISRNDSPDVPFNRSINPYRGCEHGCSYCFARPSHAWLGWSPGLDFETRIHVKGQAPKRLRESLSRRGYRAETIALGANTDPYQPAEKHLGITRRLLEVLLEFRHPVTLISKSALVTRDLDLLTELHRHRLVSVMLSVTTLDRELARRMEPRASQPRRRLEALALLARAGIPCGVLASPLIPGLNDHELEAILSAAAEAGARRANSLLIRLPREVAELFSEWLHHHYPQRAARVLSLIRQCRGGALYEAEFGKRMTGEGPYAALLARRFQRATARLGLDTPGASWSLNQEAFRVPGQPRQLPLL